MDTAPDRPGKDVPLTLSGVQKSFAGSKGLDPSEFVVWAGGVHALIDQSGSGRSAVVKIEAVHEGFSATVVPLQPTSFSSLTADKMGMAAVEVEPKLNYGVLALSQLVASLDAPPMQAGHTDVKIIDQVPDDAGFQSLKAGTGVTWLHCMGSYDTWALFDVLLRAIERQRSNSTQLFTSPVTGRTCQLTENRRSVPPAQLPHRLRQVLAGHLIRGGSRWCTHRLGPPPAGSSRTRHPRRRRH